MNWKEIWMTLFGTTEWLGLNIGFWVSMAAVVLIVVVMNVVFWGMKPKNKNKQAEKGLILSMEAPIEPGSTSYLTHKK